MRRSGLDAWPHRSSRAPRSVVVLVGKWDELEAGITGAAAGVIVLAVALQVVALVSRSEAWRVCVHASGGTVSRRKLYRASSFGCVGQLLNSQLGTAARIAALRRTAPEQTPHVPSLIAAELPILFVEAALAALTSFTLVGPLGLPWWTPILCVVAVGAVGLAFRSIAAAQARWLRKGLSVLRSQKGSARLVGFVLIAVFAQIARNWLLLHAVGVDASRVRRDRRADRRGLARPAPVRTERGRRGGRADPRPAGRGGRHGGRCAAHGHGHRRRPRLRGVGRARPARGALARS